MHTSRQQIRAVLSASIGSVFEYYDYVLYSTAAALIFGHLFFPNKVAAVATLLALASYAVGFVSRPLGSLVFGYVGDRYGRKRVMVWTLSLMGLASFSIGLLPTYAKIGILAPISLVCLRLVQGFATGGEWGAAILVSTENAPPGRRGLYGACSQAGIGVGFVLASLAFFLVRQLPDSVALDWGWRLPFLFSALIFAVGLYIRTKVRESQEYVAAAAGEHEAKAPLREVFKHYRRELVVGGTVRLAEMCGSQMITGFALAYGAVVKAPASVLLLGLVISMLIDSTMMIAFGVLSDRIGRRAIYLAGILGLATVSMAFFDMLASGRPVVIIAALVLANGLCHAAMVGVQPAILTDLFPVRLRSSGLAVAQAFSGVLAGLTPLAAMALFVHYGSTVPIILVMWTLCAVSATALAFVRSAERTSAGDAVATAADSMA